jgi:predicted O-methyltransferase YrrM
VGADPALEAAASAAAAAGLPDIAVAPNQGKLLMLFARMVGAKRILEIGTLGGYSTIWLARGLGDGGKLITLENNPRHAEVARANLAFAGFSAVVDVRVGAGADLLPKIAAAKEGPFDLFFIDADKPNNPLYFDWAMKLARPGSVIVVDNVVRGGGVADAASKEPGVVGTRAMFEMVGKEPRVTATAIQTVGVKGYDGFMIGVVR